MSLSPSEIDECLDVLYRGLVDVRSHSSDLKRVEEVVERLLELPHTLASETIPNPGLAIGEAGACVEVLHLGFVALKAAVANADSARISDIADALHNLPHLLSSNGGWSGADWTTKGFRELFLQPLIDRYPDLAPLSAPFKR